MSEDKVTKKEELANRQWQNILAFGTHHEATQTQAIEQQRKVTFEVLP